MLHVDCIRDCILNINDSDILWHDHKNIYEDEIKEQKQISLIEQLKINENDAKNKIFNATELWKNMQGFSWVVMGMFKKELVKNIRFYPQIQSEDALFGMILFASAKSIKILDTHAYTCRIRLYSASMHNDICLKSKYPLYMKDIVESGFNAIEIKQYNFAYACLYICLGLMHFINENRDIDKQLKDKLIDFICFRAIYAFGVTTFRKDPKNIIPSLKHLKPYMRLVPFKIKIAYFTPKIYTILKYIKTSLKHYTN